MRQQIVIDIIRLMGFGLHINNVQTLIRESYSIEVPAFKIWKIFHMSRGLINA